MTTSKTHKAGPAGLACVGCGKCRKVCPFLAKYGTPDQVLVRRPGVVFQCTNCRACDAACPKRLSPSQALFRKKTELLTSGAAPDAVRAARRTALSYAAWGGRFPFRRYRPAEAVFWPGCGLAGAGPDLVTGLRDHLAQVMKRKMGLVLDCCYDPAYEIGDVPAARAAAERIGERLKDLGIRQVITGCANCSKIFSLYLSRLNVHHVVELLSPDSLSPLGGAGKANALLHHPCPAFRFDRLRENAGALMAGPDGRPDEIKSPACCGLGGDLSFISPGMSQAFTERVLQAAGERPVVTYCMECRVTFENAGKDTYHILEMVRGLNRRRRKLRSWEKWLNRLRLSLIGQ